MSLHRDTVPPRGLIVIPTLSGLPRDLAENCRYRTLSNDYFLQAPETSKRRLPWADP
jgi:hypothetical protein